MTQEFFTDAYRKGIRTTTRLLVSKGLSIEEAEEFAQSAWARGWEARHQLRVPDRITTWVNTIALRQMYSIKRSGHRQEELRDKHTYDPPPVVARIDADKLLKRCSPLDKSLIVCHYSAGFNMDEIGQMYGLSGAGTRVRIHRARNALRRFALGPPVKRAA